MPKEENAIDDFLAGKPALSVELYHIFTERFMALAPGIALIPAKTMIGIATQRKRVAYITQFGREFLHVVFPFDRPYEDNLCFQKIAKVPDDNKQYNHHLRIFSPEDINEEVEHYMKLAVEKGG